MWDVLPMPPLSLVTPTPPSRVLLWTGCYIHGQGFSNLEVFHQCHGSGRPSGQTGFHWVDAKMSFPFLTQDPAVICEMSACVNPSEM